MDEGGTNKQTNKQPPWAHTLSSCVNNTVIERRRTIPYATHDQPLPHRAEFHYKRSTLHIHQHCKHISARKNTLSTPIEAANDHLTGFIIQVRVSTHRWYYSPGKYHTLDISIFIFILELPFKKFISIEEFIVVSLVIIFESIL